VDHAQTKGIAGRMPGGDRPLILVLRTSILGRQLKAATGLGRHGVGIFFTIVDVTFAVSAGTSGHFYLRFTN
jgi:hypothetical protein